MIPAGTTLRPAMSQEPLPPPYTSSDTVLNAISLAYSTLRNPRGLEVMWNGPYGQTFHELLSSYPKGSFITYSPYTLWIPKLVREEAELQEEFKKIGLDYKIPYSSATALTEAKKALFPQPQPTADTVSTTGSSVTRKSDRVANANAAKHTREESELASKINGLLEKRKAAVQKQRELAETKKRVEDLGNTSFASMVSNPDEGAADNHPDLFLTHVATVMIPEPRSLEKKFLHRLYGGRKTYHQCGAAIIELKRGANRLLTGNKYLLEGNRFVQKAQTDLLHYCSAYFASYPDAQSIVAFAAGGPLWCWTNVERADVPEWDLVKNAPTVDIYAQEHWHQRFGPLFTLGTPASDKELTTINQQHIHSLLQHSPNIPGHLVAQSVAQDDSDDDEDDDNNDNGNDADEGLDDDDDDNDDNEEDVLGGLDG